MKHLQHTLTTRAQARIDRITDLDTLAGVEDEYRYYAERSAGSWRDTFVRLAEYAKGRHKRMRMRGKARWATVEDIVGVMRDG